MSVTPANATLVPNQPLQLNATARNSSGSTLSGKTFTWSSTASGVASVGAGDGMAMGVSPGNAEIRATSEGQTGDSDITVIEGGWITPAGGQVSAFNGAVIIDVPPGAVAVGTAFTVASLTDPTVPALSQSVTGTLWDLGPSPANFAQPVTVRLRYELANLPPGVPPEQLVVWRYDGAAWVPLGGTELDAGTRFVSGETTQFSGFGLGALFPPPTIQTLNPSQATAGDPGFDMVVTGTGFTQGSEVRWNGALRTTTFNSSTQLTAAIPQADVAVAGQANVTVFTPAPGGGTSDGLPFTINPPPPDDLIVTTLLDGIGGGLAGECSLRAAITAANTDLPVDACPAGDAGAPDPITFAPALNGTLTLGSDQTVITSDIEIDGDNRIQVSGDNLFLPFQTFGNVSFTIQNIVIRNGTTGSGAGIAHAGAGLTLDNVTLTANTATGSGGAIHVSSPIGVTPVVNITHSTFSQNTAAVVGGAIRIRDNTPGLTTQVTISDSEFFQNVAVGPGGAIHNDNSILTITNTSIHNNAGTAGGGIYSSGVQATTRIDRSVLRMNTATFLGGGLFLWDNAVLIHNSTISYNTANESLGEAGGGIFFQGSAIITLRNATVAMNMAPNGGAGGIERSILAGGFPAMHFYNTLVGPQGFGPNCVGGPAGFVSQDFNLENANTCNFVSLNDIVNGVTALGVIQDNGGPTWTHALLPGSQAIDAGDNAVCLADPVNGTDQRGLPRNDGLCDIGAFEVQALQWEGPRDLVARWVPGR